MFTRGYVAWCLEIHCELLIFFVTLLDLVGPCWDRGAGEFGCSSFDQLDQWRGLVEEMTPGRLRNLGTSKPRQDCCATTEMPSVYGFWIPEFHCFWIWCDHNGNEFFLRSQRHARGSENKCISKLVMCAFVRPICIYDKQSKMCKISIGAHLEHIVHPDLCTSVSKCLDLHASPTIKPAWPKVMKLMMKSRHL